jgi:cytochrome c5
MKWSGVLGMVVACGVAAGCREQPPAAVSSTPPSMSSADALILAAVKVGLPPANVAPADLPDPHSRGAGLLGKYCAQCHSLPTPVAHSATDWPGVVRRMWLRMDYIADSFGVHKPSSGERYDMLQYLTTNALQVSGAVLPSGAGRGSFEVICSRCHALPDPRSHSPQDWEVVYARMVKNMERMAVALPSETQGNDIIMYLRGLRRVAPER